MDRPSRKTKAVNYCESKDLIDDDDEDFACAKGPPRKKTKEALNQLNNTKPISCQEFNSQSPPSQKSRKPLDLKIYERDLETAISLSMLNPSNKTSNQLSALKEERVVRTAVDENTEPSVLSNCSVDGMCLGLDQITSDSTASSKEKKETSDVQRNKLKIQDDDYQPCVVLDSESDSDYSEHESEDEEFAVKKARKRKKDQVTKNGKAKQTPSTKKQKKPQKSKSAVVSTPTRTPLSTKNITEPTRSVSLKMSKPAACSVSRVPKWNPPGQIGKSPSSSNSTPVRPPGQGLRLGLSRLVRVKPLHPNVTSP